jgi:hypothetical protein
LVIILIASEVESQNFTCEADGQCMCWLVLLLPKEWDKLIFEEILEFLYHILPQEVSMLLVCVCVWERERERRIFSGVMSCHRHGVRQLRTGWYDGVPYVTQCPLQQNASFTYR